MSYDEIISFGHELIGYLEKFEDDGKVIDETQEMLADITKLRSKQEAHIKKTIQGLIDLEEEELKKNPDACRTNSAEQIEEEENLNQKIAESKTYLEKTNEESERKKIKLEEAVSERKALRARREKIKTEVNVSLPKARYEVNLSSHITNIRWRYDSKPNEVVGYMCDKNNVRPFSFDTNQVSDHFITNYLWDLMEEDW